MVVLEAFLFNYTFKVFQNKECSNCGNIDKKNRLKQDKFKCTACGFETNPDILPSQTILKRGLESFGLGTNLVDLNKHKAFRSTSLEVASQEAPVFWQGWVHTAGYHDDIIISFHLEEKILFIIPISNDEVYKMSLRL